MAEEMLLQDMKYLTNKKIVLSSPGYALNDLYYSNSDSVVEATECTYSTGRYQYSLQSAQFGSASQIIIPNSSFVGQLYLHATLTLPTNVNVGNAWLYSSIASVSYIFGSSNVPQITLGGQSLFELALLECDTAEKRNALMIYSGAATRNTGAAVKISADCVIPLPFSSLVGLVPKRLFDTNLLQNPIIIQINFNQASSIFAGVGVKPSAFDNATAYIRQGDLTNKAESLRNALRLDPGVSMNYPFIHHQTYTPGPHTGVVAGGASNVSLALQSIINADLVGLSFHVMKQADLASGDYFNWQEVTNISLLYNGLIIYYAPGSMHKLVSMMDGNLGSPSAQYALATSASSNEIVPTMINFSRMKSLSFTNHFANTFRIPNNTLTLQYNTPDTDQYVCFVTYHYNGMAQIQNGQANIYFD